MIDPKFWLSFHARFCTANTSKRTSCCCLVGIWETWKSTSLTRDQHKTWRHWFQTTEIWMMGNNGANTIGMNSCPAKVRTMNRTSTLETSYFWSRELITEREKMTAQSPAPLQNKMTVTFDIVIEWYQGLINWHDINAHVKKVGYYGRYSTESSFSTWTRGRGYPG